MMTETARASSTSHWIGKNYHFHSEQQKMVADCLLAQFRFKETDHVLDVGCGDGKITDEIALAVPKGSVLGLDPAEEMIAFAKAAFKKENLQFSIGKASSVSTVQAYNVITSFSALHWEKEQKKALSAFYRALKPGGSILLAVPGPDFVLRGVLKEMSASASWGHFFEGYCSPGKVWKVNEYTALLLETGFEIQKIEWVERNFCYNDEISYKAFLLAMLPHLSKVPENLRISYVDETTSRIKQKRHVTADGGIRFDVRVIEVIAHVPS